MTGLSLSELPVLSRSVHDRAALRREDPDWLAGAWRHARVLPLTPPSWTVPVIDGPTGPRLAWRGPDGVPADAERYFLGEYAGTPFFAATAPAEPVGLEPPAEPVGLEPPTDAAGREPAVERAAGLRELGADLDALDAGLLTAAVGLAQWHSRHPRCPLCGSPTGVIRGGWTRRCPTDGSDHWPRTDPAVIMLVHDGADRCVMGRQASWPDGRFSILAGFLEPGESAEAAVAREVGEEVGLRVTDVRYLGSQPWPFPCSLMLGFTARLDGDPTLRLRDGELSEARWVTREQVRRQQGVRLSPTVSIAYRILTDWAG